MIGIERYVAVYKGEIIAQGMTKEVRNSLKTVFDITDDTRLKAAISSLPVYKNITYVFEKFSDELSWTVRNIPSAYENRARLFDGILEFDNT